MLSIRAGMLIQIIVRTKFKMTPAANNPLTWIGAKVYSDTNPNLVDPSSSANHTECEIPPSAWAEGSASMMVTHIQQVLLPTMADTSIMIEPWVGGTVGMPFAVVNVNLVANMIY